MRGPRRGDRPPFGYIGDGAGAPDLRRGGHSPVAGARPVPDLWAGAMADHIAVSGCVLVDASCAAPARLGMLAKDGMLLRASELAYGDGITGLVQAAGPAAGLTRLAGVCLGNLAETDDRAHLALQWQAIAADGKLFTALDADLMLVNSPPERDGGNGSIERQRRERWSRDAPGRRSGWTRERNPANQARRS